MSIPPDQFDENGDPIDFDEQFDQENVAWRGEGDPPEWFINNAELFWQMDHRESIFLQIDAGNNPEYHSLNADGTYTVPILAIDNDSGEQIPVVLDHMSYDELMDFYYYTTDYYDDIVFWPDGGSGDLGAF